jgi:hypothetical protein
VVVDSSPVPGNVQGYQEQLVTGTDKKRREALAALLQSGTAGVAVLQDFLLGVHRGTFPLDSVAGRGYAQLSQQSEDSIQAFLRQHFPQDLVPVPSDRNIDYGPLQSLLVQGDFEAADRLTLSKMCELAGSAAQQRKWLYFSEVDQFPVTDLRTIDRLWRVYSDDQFGFSVQRDIWLGVGQDWDKLWPKIGWKSGRIWTRYPGAFTWNLQAPKGHLPLTNQLRGVRVMASLMNHPAFQSVPNPVS